MSSRIKEEFIAFTPRRKKLVLASLIHSFAIATRADLKDDGTLSASDTHRINDLSHISSSKLADMLSGTTKQYPDDVFMNIILEIAEPDFSRELEWLWNRATGSLVTERVAS